MKKLGLGTLVALSVAAVLVWRGVIPTSISGAGLPTPAWASPTSWYSWLLGDESTRELVKLAVTLLLGTGGILALTYKFFLSEGRARFDARRKFTETVTTEISNLARSHYWALANYSGTLAAQFEAYIDAQNQLLLFRWDPRSRLQTELRRRALRCADNSFWTFCQLLVRFDDFQFRGSNTYLLTTHASGELAKKLYNSFVAALPQESGSRIDTLKILKTLRESPPREIVIATAKGDERLPESPPSECERIADLPARSFLDGVDRGAFDLREVREAYTAWICDQAASVEEAAQSLRAYSELLTHELALLHEQWFLRRRGLWTTDWPENAVSSGSMQTMQRVRFESALLEAMPTWDEPRSEREFGPREKERERQIGTYPWEKSLPPHAISKGELSEGSKYVGSMRTRIGEVRNFVRVKLRPTVPFLLSKLADVRESLPIREHVRRQVRGIRAAQLRELYGGAIRAFVREGDAVAERDEKFRTSAERVLSYLRKRTLLELRRASILEALLAYSAHERDESMAARRHARAALRYAKRAYKSINRMNELSIDRRRLGFFGVALAILYRERGLLLAEAGRFRRAERMLVKAQQVQLDWDGLDEDRLGTLAQLKAQAVAKTDSESALKILQDSYLDLRKHGATRMAGRTRFQAAQLLQLKGESEKALTAFAESYRCYQEPADPLSLATILEEIAVLYIGRQNFTSALHALDQAIEYSKWEGQRLQLLCGRCLARRGVLKFGLGQYAKAGDEIMQAVALFRAEEWASPWEYFVRVTRSLLGDATRRACVQRLMGKSARAEPDTGKRAWIVDLVMEFLTELGEKTANPNDSVDRIGSPAPLTVAIDPKTLPYNWEVPKSIDLLRERLTATYGVKVPGIRYRLDESLEEPVYQIGIMGVHQRFRHEPSDELPHPEIDPEPFGPFWAPTRKVFETVERRLDEFVGHQEIQNLLEVKFGDEMRADIAGFQTHSHISPLTTVSQSLLAEGMPIAEFREIRKRVLEGLDREESLQEIVESIRAEPEIHGGWPRAGGESLLLEIGSTFERELRNHSSTVGQFVVLTASRETQLCWIDEIKKVISPGVNLVLRDDRLRPLVRQIIRPELPETQVLVYHQLGSSVLVQLKGVLEGPRRSRRYKAANGGPT